MIEIKTSQELIEWSQLPVETREPAKVEEFSTISGLSAVKSLTGLVVGNRCSLYGLSSLTSLSGVTLGKGCKLSGLSSVTSLEGLTMGELCGLYDLSSVTSLAGLTMGDLCNLYDLSSVTSLANLPIGNRYTLRGLPASFEIDIVPTEAELKILKQIPLDKLEMVYWHSTCDTSHCLAGWAQVLSGLPLSAYKAWEDGCRILPSCKPIFFAPTKTVKRWLQKLQGA